MGDTLAPPALNGTGPAIGGPIDPDTLARSMIATLRPSEPPTDDHPNPAHRDQLARWVGMANIADDPDVEDQIERLAVRVKSDFDIDDNSRAEWKTNYRKWLDFALQIAQAKTYPWPNASNVIYPLMTIAAIQFAARAYPAIIRDRNVVKGTVVGDDNGVQNPEFAAFIQQQQQAAAAQAPGPMGPGMPGMPSQGPMVGDGAASMPPGLAVPGPGMPPPGAIMPGMGPANGGAPSPWLVPPGEKQARADRIGRHMSWQLLTEQEEWEPQTDTLLIALPIVGTYFRKTYYDPSLRRNVSEAVDALALCVNYRAKSFETAPRHTELIRLYPWEIEGRIRADLFVDWGDGADDYGRDNMGGDDGNDQGDEDAPTTFLEQHRRWDLDGDGYPEPYIVTVARDNGKLARIRAGYDMEGVHWRSDGQVRQIDKIDIYTKYGFIPSPDSKVYDLGFGHLLYPINEAINTTLNQMFDAGHLQNVGGGFIGSGLSINTGALRFAMGEYKPVNTVGGTIRDNVFPIPFPGPSPVLMQLLEFLVQAGERIAAVKDIMVGDMPGDNTSGITTLAVIEQGLQVFSAVYKRVHRSLGYEFKKLYRLNLKRRTQTFRYQDGEVWKEIERRDYEDGAGVEPISDPRMVTDMQRLGRAQFLLGFKDDPRVNGATIILDAMRAAMIPTPERYMSNTPPQPDPKIVVKNRELDIRQAREMLEGHIKAEHAKAIIIRDIAQAELFLAQTRKLDNDAQLGWVQQHIETLRARVDAITAFSDAIQSAADGGTESAAAA